MTVIYNAGPYLRVTMGDSDVEKFEADVLQAWRDGAVDLNNEHDVISFFNICGFGDGPEKWWRQVKYRGAKPLSDRKCPCCNRPLYNDDGTPLYHH